MSVNSKVAQLHGEVMSKFMQGACSDLLSDTVVECVEKTLRELGFRVTDIRLFTLDGEETSNIENARYVRVEAKHELTEHEDVLHIFTFAIMRHGDRYKVLYLQSAIKTF